MHWRRFNHAESAVEEARGTSSLARISAPFLARAAQSLDSTTLLSAKEMLADALSVARTVVELDIEHAYILAAPDVEERFGLYLISDDVPAHDLAKGIAALHDSKVDQNALTILKERAKPRRWPPTGHGVG